MLTMGKKKKDITPFGKDITLGYLNPGKIAKLKSKTSRVPLQIIHNL